jgi:hypothetical protein
MGDGAVTRVSGDVREALGRELREAYEAGASIRELAAQTGRSYGFVHRLLGESGASYRGRGGATRGRSRMDVED